MSFVRLRFVGSTVSGVFTNDTIYDVIGWGADNPNSPLAIILDDSGEPNAVQVRNSTDWDVESTFVADIRSL